MPKGKTIKFIDWIEPEYLGLDWSGHNLPTPHQEISRDEFESLAFMGQTLHGVGYRQIRMDDDPGYKAYGYVEKSCWGCHFRFFPQCAIGHASLYIGSDRSKIDFEKGIYTSEGRSLRGTIVARGELENTDDYYLVRYYRLGCTHPNTKEKKLGRHDYETTCLDCGWSTCIDSSG